MYKTLLTSLSLFLTFTAFSQTNLEVKKDTVKVRKAELIIENSTRSIPGFLYNTGNGHTVFRRLDLVNVGDTAMAIAGLDTLNYRSANEGKSIQFKVGESAGYPVAGDTSYTNTAFRFENVKVWRNGLFQHPDTVEGIMFDGAAGSIRFYPALAQGEQVYIETTALGAVDKSIFTTNGQLGADRFIGGNNSSHGLYFDSLSVIGLMARSNTDLNDRAGVQVAPGNISFSSSNAGAQSAFTLSATTSSHYIALYNGSGGNNTGIYISDDNNVGVGTAAPASKLHVNGTFGLPIRTTSVNTTLTDTDYTVICLVTGLTVTLPSAVGCPGRVYLVKSGLATGSLTLQAQGAELIDGSNLAIVDMLGSGPGAIGPWPRITVQSDGTQWWIISGSVGAN